MRPLTRRRVGRKPTSSIWGTNKRTVDAITPYMSISDRAVSHALTLLCDAGLIEKQKDGRSRSYSVTERAEALVDALDHTR